MLQKTFGIGGDAGDRMKKERYAKSMGQFAPPRHGDHRGNGGVGAWYSL